MIQAKHKKASYNWQVNCSDYNCNFAVYKPLIKTVSQVPDIHEYLKNTKHPVLNESAALFGTAANSFANFEVRIKKKPYLLQGWPVPASGAT